MQTRSYVANGYGACVLLNVMFDISELPCFLLQQLKEPLQRVDPHKEQFSRLLPRLQPQELVSQARHFQA